MKIGRIIETLAYFEVLPFFKCFQKLFRFNRAKTETTKNMGKILVVGATGGVGKRVVKILLENNYAVKALVRDKSRAKEILADYLDKINLFEADITIPTTLSPQLITDVQQIICCTGTRVQPREGDTPKREKYYQGVKFYSPEVVDNPEQVEYRGIENLVRLAKNLKPITEKTIFDFTDTSLNISASWGVIDDIVMGGVSQSSIILANGVALFSGNVSTANSGGFASVRTRNFIPPLNLKNYQGIQLRIRGDGKRYKFIARCEEKWDGIAYCYSFDTIPGVWQTIQIPFEALIPVFRAKTVKDAEKFDPSKVFSLQLMLSKFEYDGALNPRFAPGSFSLEIESIKAYGGKPLPQFIMISSAGVTRLGKPGLDLSQQPPAVRMNEQLGGILTWKLAGENAVRESGLTYTIIRPCALTEKPFEKKLEFAQGDTIMGEVSREAIAHLCVAILEISAADNKTFEVRETTGETNRDEWETILEQLKEDK